VFFVDVAPKDGVPDLLFEVTSGRDQPSHLLLLRARADGTYDDTAPVLDPKIVRDQNGNMVAMPPGSKWVATVDMNKDGIPDLVMRTPNGAVVALAEVKHP
jgi:hypothetical protein